MQTDRFHFLRRMARRMVAVAFILLFCPLAAHAGQYGGYASPEEYGMKLYYKYHPAKRHFDPYPFAGALIKDGQDIPVCAEAKKPEAYLYKTAVKYMFHGKDGWLFRTADFRTDFMATPRTMDYLRRLNQALTGQGQILIMALQPPRAMVERQHIDPTDTPKGYDPAEALRGYKAFISQLRAAGILTVDLSEVPAGFDYFPKGDFHWTPEGADYTASRIAEFVRKLPDYGSLKKQDFESRVTGYAKNPVRGAFQTFIQDTCKVNIEMLPQRLWTTEAKGSGAAGLLDDTGYPGVTVVGTSNSAEDDKFNFIGALRHYLRTDVYNAAIVAGGFGSSAFRYFSSSEYKQAPPKFIVWEFLPQHAYNTDKSAVDFRQMIPAVYGACGEKEAIATDSRDIKATETPILHQADNQSVKNSYLYMEVTDPVERSLKVNILYGDGNADVVDLTRSTRAENNGKYYLDLGNATRPIVFTHVVTDKPSGHVTARFCHYPVNLASR